MTEKPEEKVLGKNIAYPKAYSPDILVAVPRSENRLQYNLNDATLPFVGFDAWHAYEVGFLTTTGLPVSGILKIVYSCKSTHLVESKSLKLYLNSFNHEQLGKNTKDAVHNFLAKVQQDLSSLLKTEIQLNFFDSEDAALPFDFNNFKKLEDETFAESLIFTNDTEEPNLLQFASEGGLEVKLCSELLRSNCKITNQPDWGSIFIHIKTNKPVDKGSFLKYIVSFRNENHFHEEVCEMIYKRLLDYYAPTFLMVACLYTRRGGIDICPVRCSSPQLLPMGLSNVSTLTKKTLRQ